MPKSEKEGEVKRNGRKPNAIDKKPRRRCDVSQSNQRGNPPGGRRGDKQESLGSGPRDFAWMAEVDKSVDRGCGGCFVRDRTELRIHMSVLRMRLHDSTHGQG